MTGLSVAVALLQLVTLDMFQDHVDSSTSIVSEHREMDNRMEDVTRWLQVHRSQLKVDASGNLTHIQAHRDKLQVLSPRFLASGSKNVVHLLDPTFRMFCIVRHITSLRTWRESEGGTERGRCNLIIFVICVQAEILGLCSS